MSTDEPLDPVEGAIESAAEVESTESHRGLSRRTFLKAAALGTAAAALLQKDALGNFSLGSLPAYADDLSTLGCTANDVRLVNSTITINEPCSCSASSCSLVNVSAALTVTNTAGSARYCAYLHLCPVSTVIGSCTATLTFAPILIAQTLQPKALTIVSTTFQWMCGLGTVVVGSDALPHGNNLTCPTGSCCNVVTWQVPGASDAPTCSNAVTSGAKYNNSKCGFQPVTLVGRSLGLNCVTASGATACQASCGATVVLVATASPAGTYPYTFCSVVAGVTACASATTNPTLIASPTTDTTYIVGANILGCPTSTTLVVIAVPALAAPSLTTSTADCSGCVTVTASVSGATTFCFSSPAALTTTPICVKATSDIASVTFCYSNATTSSPVISVTATSSGGCTNSNSATAFIPAVLAVSLPSLTGNTCAAGADSSVTITAAATGGTSPYAYTWSPTTDANGTTVTGAVFTYGQNLDNSCHTVGVSVTDSHSCSATAATNVKVKQCVNTSFSC
jgi:hypothetical protein